MPKTILVTGGASGIGAAAVRKFAQGGWRVTFLDVNARKAKELIEAVDSAEPICFYKGTTDSRGDLEAALELAADDAGGIDALFVNAGIYRPGSIIDMEEASLAEMIQTNIVGTINTLQSAIPYLANAEEGTASVVLAGAGDSLSSATGNCGYGLTQAAIGQIARSAAADLAHLGIRVNAVCPQAVATPMGAAMTKHSSSDDTMVTPEEVASFVYFLCGDEAGASSGNLYQISSSIS